MSAHLIALGIIDGASPVGAATTLTSQDLVNLKNAVWGKVLEGNVTATQMMKVFFAVLAGWSDLHDNMVPRYHSPVNRNLVRVQYSTDENGNRIKQLVLDLD